MSEMSTSRALNHPHRPLGHSAHREGLREGLGESAQVTTRIRSGERARAVPGVGQLGGAFAHRGARAGPGKGGEAGFGGLATWRPCRWGVSGTPQRAGPPMDRR